MADEGGDAGGKKGVKFDDKPMEKGGENDCSSGPIANRKQTDIIFCLLFLAHWVGFIAVAFMGLQTGAPARLTSMRDYKGAYCGLASNYNPWNKKLDATRGSVASEDFQKYYDMVTPDGASTYVKMGYMMNTTSILGQLSDNIACNTAVKQWWDARPDSPQDSSKRCPSAAGGLPSAGDMAAFSDPSQAFAKLTGGGGASALSKVTKYFSTSCVTSCDSMDSFAAKDAAGKKAEGRLYKYLPDPDDPTYDILKALWTEVSDPDSSLKAFKALLDPLELVALPASVCKDDPKFCVPFAGMRWKETPKLGATTPSMCMFSLGSDSAAGAAMSDAASKAMDKVLKGSVMKDMSSGADAAMGELITCWYVILVVAVLSVALGFVFLILLKFFVGVIIWVSIFSVEVLLIAGGLYGMLYATGCKADEDSLALAAAAPPANTTSPAYQAAQVADKAQAAFALASGTAECPEGQTYNVPDPQTREYYKYGAYAMLGLAGLYLLVICCMCNRIKLGIAINKVAAQFVGQCKGVLFVPIVQIAVAIVWWALWLYIATWLVSVVTDDSIAYGTATLKNAGADFTNKERKFAMSWQTANGWYGKDAMGVSETQGTPGECTGFWPSGGVFKDTIGSGIGETAQNPDCKWVDGVAPRDARCWRCTLPRWAITPTFWFATFSLLWNNAFLIAVGQCTIAGAVGYWYFCPNAEKGTKPMLRPALKNCFRYHMGSLAFGAFILAIVQIIKLYLYYMQKQFEAAKNKVMVKIAQLLQYLVHCFERFLKFLNKNAYIQIALLGKPFCKSAWNAFCLILRNMARIGVLGGIGSIVNFLGMASITAGTACLGFLIADAWIPTIAAMNGAGMSLPWLWILLFAMVGYVCGKLFMNVFGLAVDAILQCFVADEELHASGETGGAQYTPELLKGFLKDPNAKKGCCKK